VAEEVPHRQQTRIQRLTRRADFPFLKTIEEFDFTYQSTLRLSLLGSTLSPDFVTEGRCLILSGKSGRGKTHLAVAIAYRAIQNGFEAFFTTAAKLIDDLSGASREGRLREALVRYTHPHLLVIDEVGYLGYGDDAANVLFHVVNDRHLRKRSMVFTTNKALGSWGRVLHDPDLAAAIVDRILERGRLIPLDGPSLRTRHLGLDDPTDPQASLGHARISGIDRPEFPEPTSGAPSPLPSAASGARGWGCRARAALPPSVPSGGPRARTPRAREVAEPLPRDVLLEAQVERSHEADRRSEADAEVCRAPQALPRA
jgi:DNA replication protein DnaC